MDIKQWAKEFADCIAATLHAWHKQSGDKEIVMLAVDCHPWDGVLELTLLTTAEATQDPLLNSPEEMAAWEHFHFSSALPDWTLSRPLATAMQTAYKNAEATAEVAETYFKAGAISLRSDPVQAVLLKLNRSSAFTLSVAHPDTGKEYCAG